MVIPVYNLSLLQRVSFPTGPEKYISRLHNFVFIVWWFGVSHVLMPRRYATSLQSLSKKP